MNEQLIVAEHFYILIDAQPLHGRAWKIVEPLIQNAQHDTQSRFEELKDSEQTSTDLETIIPAAVHGWMEILFVELGIQRWSSYNPLSNHIRIDPEARSGNDEPLQVAYNHVIVNGGSIYAVEKQHMPGKGLLAAVFR